MSGEDTMPITAYLLDLGTQVILVATTTKVHYPHVQPRVTHAQDYHHVQPRVTHMQSQGYPHAQPRVTYTQLTAQGYPHAETRVTHLLDLGTPA